MKKVLVKLEVMVELEIEDDLKSIDEECIFDAVNELDYSFNSYEEGIHVNDYFIRDMTVWEVK